MTELVEDKLPAKPEELSSEEHRSHHNKPEQAVGQSESNGVLYLIDTKHRHILNQVIVPGTVHHNAITPDGKHPISTHPTKGLISVVDIRAARVVRRVRTGAVPNYALINRDGSMVYVSNSGDNTVSEIDTGSWQIIRQLPAGDTPAHITLSPDERILRAYPVVSQAN